MSVICRLMSVVACCIVSAAMAADPPGGNPMPPAAAEILSRMDKEITIARVKAAKDLDRVLKETTKKGDLAGAMAVKEAMDGLKASVSNPSGPANAGLVGRWQTQSGMFEFHADGTASVPAMNLTGTWSFNGRIFLVKLSNATQYEMQLTASGAEGLWIYPGRDSKKTAWTRAP